jgi:hypothetical protein
MSQFARRILGITLLGALSMLLTACSLRALFGNVIIVQDIEAEVNEIITTVFSDSTAAVCLDTDYGFYECTYIIDGDIITSTLYLLSEFGLTGVLIDPVILQVPADVTDVIATYDDGSGPRPLSTRSTGSFQVTPDLSVTAEADREFLILELPASVVGSLPEGDPNSGPEFAYSLGFKRVQPLSDPVLPMQVKLMLAGKVIINEHTYYVPMLPCVADFASIPALELPQSVMPVDLQPTVGDLIRQGGQVGCDHQAYYFDNVPLPPLKVFMPLISR